jgi:transcriptional regulator GlxA family with amidase domain
VAWQYIKEMPNAPQIPPDLRRVEILVFPDVQILDVTGPFQVFAGANRQAEESGQREPYALKVVASVPGPVVSSGGLAFLAEALPPADLPLDTLVIAGGHGIRSAFRDRSLVDWVTQRARVARRVTSVCSGAFILAATGLLDGRRATTHWYNCSALASIFPAVQVERDPIYINDGPIWTSAGVTAGIDMALALVEADLGRTMATTVARHLVVFVKRPGGQAQFSTDLALAGSDTRFERLHDWMKRNLRENLAVPVLAEQAGMSERSFLRHYRQSTGMTPARAVEFVRVEVARQALAEAFLPLKRIARDCGFGSEETMRRSFVRILGVSPQAYRERFPV